MLSEQRIDELSWECDTKERAMQALRTAAREAMKELAQVLTQRKP